jgi:hypothetical protein
MMNDGNVVWWAPFKDLKEAYPVEVANYVKFQNLMSDPAFSWWVPYTFRKRDVIISSVKARARRITHKYSIELPKDVDDAYALDR